MSKIKVYVAHAMTGKMKDELVREAEYTTRQLQAYGFEVLDPIVAENIQDVHEPLVQLDSETLERHWRRDKEMLKEADLMLDFNACNKSDGVAKELGYTRFCLWKPVIRVFPNCGINISRIEDDVIVETLPEAIQIMNEKYGSFVKLHMWRQKMLDRSFNNWIAEQNKMNERYGITTSLVGVA